MKYYVEGCGKPVRIRLGEDAFLNGSTNRYIDGRQKAIFLIPLEAPQQQEATSFDQREYVRNTRVARRDGLLQGAWADD